MSTGGYTGGQDTGAQDLSGLGDATTGQNAGTAGDGDITIYQDQDTGGTTNYDYASGIYPAWTDPNTGIQYDVYGNPLPGQM